MLCIHRGHPQRIISQNTLAVLSYGISVLPRLHTHKTHVSAKVRQFLKMSLFYHNPRNKLTKNVFLYFVIYFKSLNYKKIFSQGVNLHHLVTFSRCPPCYPCSYQLKCTIIILINLNFQMYIQQHRLLKTILMQNYMYIYNLEIFVYCKIVLSILKMKYN